MERRKIGFKYPEALFVGSYFAMDQLPGDKLPHVAVAGRSNVGKSSLLNQVVGQKKLARVSSTPGRTRSLNFFKVDSQYYLVDLPGYGYAKVSKTMRAEWGELMEQYLTTSDNLIGMVLLLDCRRDLADQDWQLIEWLSERELPTLVAITKADKLGRDKMQQKVRQIETDLGIEAIAFSAVNGTGKKALMSAIRGLVKEHTSLTGTPRNG